jgi:hypothetical protein
MRAAESARDEMLLDGGLRRRGERSVDVCRKLGVRMLRHMPPSLLTT